MVFDGIQRFIANFSSNKDTKGILGALDQILFAQEGQITVELLALGVWRIRALKKGTFIGVSVLINTYAFQS